MVRRSAFEAFTTFSLSLGVSLTTTLFATPLIVIKQIVRFSGAIFRGPGGFFGIPGLLDIRGLLEGSDFHGDPIHGRSDRLRCPLL